MRGPRCAALNPKKIPELLERLEAEYGTAQWHPRFDPMEELVSCILSQHTSDVNSYPTYFRLRERFPTWEGMAAAQESEIAEVIRSAGLANQKAKSIAACLREIKCRTGAYSLDFLRELPPLEARKWLTSLPGVGPKTATIVLCFALGADLVPVDTHVYRVSWRIGLIPEKIGENKAHDLLNDVLPKGVAFRLHMAFINHGRAVCKAPLPLCGKCVVRDLCRWFRTGGPEKKRIELAEARRR